jgi:hypothetical protein
MSAAISSNWQTRLTALFLRMLREDVRNALPHGIRGVVAIAVYGIVFLMAATLDTRSTAPGLQIFRWVMWANVTFIYLSSVGYFAAAVAEEREEETLGLLLMAGVSPTTLLFGKSISRLIVATLVLAAQLPIVSLCSTFGGVLQIQVHAFFFALFCHAVFASQLALFASVRCRTVMGAGWMTGALLALAWFGPWLAQGFLARSIKWIPLLSTPLSPLVNSVDFVHENMVTFRLGSILSSTFGSTAAQSWFGALITPHECGSLLAAGLFFGLAYAGFDRFALSVAEPNAPAGEPFLLKLLKPRRPASARTPSSLDVIEPTPVPTKPDIPTPSLLSPEQREALVHAAMARVERKYGIPVQPRVHYRRWPSFGVVFAKDWRLVTGGFPGLIKRYAGYMGAVFLLIGVFIITVQFPPSLQDFLEVWFIMGSWTALVVEGGWNACGIVSVDVRAKATQSLRMLPIPLWRQCLSKLLVVALPLIPALILLWMGTKVRRYTSYYDSTEQLFLACLVAIYLFALALTVRGAFVLPRVSPVVGFGAGAALIFVAVVSAGMPIQRTMFGLVSAEDRLFWLGTMILCCAAALTFLAYREFDRLAAAD